MSEKSIRAQIHSNSRSESQNQAAVQLNASGRRSSTPSGANGSSNRCLIAVIVYLALLLDNMLLTVIVPILPDYLASLEADASSAVVLSLEDTSSFSKLGYRSGESPGGGHPQLYISKHPIPGKSMVNFTLLQLSTEATTTTTRITTTATSPHNSTSMQSPPNGQSGGTNVTEIGHGSGHKSMNRKLASGNPPKHDNNSNNSSNNNSNKELTLTQENGSIGLLLAMKALVQLIFNPIVGNASSKFGYRLPIVVGTFFLLISSLVFTVGESYREVVVEDRPKWRTLLECKMILAIVLAIWFSTSTMAMLEPYSVGYFVGTNFFGSIAYKYGQVKVSCISLLLVGVASILIPSATTVAQLLLPHFALGLGIGVIDAALVPLLATFVDATLAQEDQGEGSSSMSSYGTVYAIQQTSVSLAYCLAPLIGGELAQTFGFAWLMRIVGIFNMIYGPILVYLHQKYDPKALREQHNDMLLQSSGRGSRYKQLYNSMDVE
ncbi:GM23549 [Drosophila sechellia]|uniref:GM23549 n=1 Tax=Drosophila sechellia TaxID=7238 RepID=B4HFW6_DROSE|nr:GM23549 [Drosophila sechellia]